MKNYEKPMILNMGTYEGIYAASGDVTTGGGDTPNPPQAPDRQCMSIWMNGVYHPSDWSDWENGTNIDGRGCEGCPAQNGSYCRFDTGEVNWDDDFRPSWEVQGKGPYDKWNQ